MSRNQVVLATGISGGILALVAVAIGWQVIQPAVAYGATPTSGGIWSLVLSLVGASGLSITSLVTWLTGGRISKSTPELLASLVAWLAAKDDKQLERRFVLAVLATLDELFADQPRIKSIVATLGLAIVDDWLPGGRMSGGFVLVKNEQDAEASKAEK